MAEQSEKVHRKLVLTPEWEAKLGVVHDRVIAEQFGVSTQTIYGIRTAKNIKPCGKHHQTHHTKMEPAAFDSLVKELGTMRDSHLAKKYNVSREYIRQLRTKQGIAKYFNQKVQVS